MSAARILVVEDNPRIGAKLVEVLERAGYAVALAADGTAARAALARASFDLALVEHHAPEAETSQRLPAHLFATSPDTPLVVMATTPSARAELGALGVPSRGFLLKPFRVPELLAAMESALGERPRVASAPTPPPSRAGTLDAGGFGPLLTALFRAGTTGRLTLERDGVERVLYLLGGLLVFAESNLLAETFGRYLMARGTIDEAAYQAVQAHTEAHGVRQGEALVALGLLDNHEIYTLLRAQVRERIVRCFDWPLARYALHEEERFVDHKLLFPMNPLSLLVEGTWRQSPPSAHQAFFDRHRARALGPTALADEWAPYLARLQRDAHLDAVLARRLPLGELARTLKLNEPRVAALASALIEAGVACWESTPADALAPHATTPALAPHDTDPAAPPDAVSAEDPRLFRTGRFPAIDARAQAVFETYLRTCSEDHFAVLGLPPDAPRARIEAAWLDLSRRFRPDAMCDHPDPEVRERAREIFIRAGAAYAALAHAARAPDPTPAAPHARRAADPARAAEAWFAKGERRMRTGDTLGAVTAFERAREIAPSEPLYEMHLGWARFLAATDAPGRAEAEALLARGIGRDPAHPLGHALRARLLRATGREPEAQAEERRATQLAQVAPTTPPSDPTRG